MRSFKFRGALPISRFLSIAYNLHKYWCKTTFYASGAEFCPEILQNRWILNSAFGSAFLVNTLGRAEVSRAAPGIRRREAPLRLGSLSQVIMWIPAADFFTTRSFTGAPMA